MNAILESLNAFSAAGLTAVLNTLWLALAVAAVLWLALRLMPRVNAATRHAVWWVVLALVVLLPLATLFPRPRPAPPEPSSARTELPIQPYALSFPASKPLHVRGPDAPAPPLPTAADSRVSRVHRISLPFEVHPGNWPSSLLLVWIVVSAVLLGRIVCSYFRLRAMIHRARPANADLVLRFEKRLRDSRTARAPQILVSDEVISPFAAGFLHPVVILPEILLDEIEATELDYVLLHELAHIARRDDWTNLMSRLASAVLFLHPVATWVLRRIQREREIACDDWVVASTGSSVPYAVTLARLSEFCSTRRRELLATGMASSNLSKRIEILLRPRSHFSAGASLTRVGVCVTAGIALVSFGVRVPGWIALAKDANALGKSQISTPRSGLAAASSPIPPPLLVATLSPAYQAQSSTASPVAPADEDKTWRHEWKLRRRDSSSNKVELSLISRDDEGNDRMNTQDVPLSSLSGFSRSMLDQEGPIRFEYVRNAGSILCEGRAAPGHASGPFTVALNSSFVSALEKMGYAAPHDDESFSLVTSDMTLGYAQAVRDTGLTTSISDLIELQDHGVSSDYVRAVRQEGFIDLSAQNISELRDHGVEPNYLKAIKAAGSNLSIEEIASLRDHGVKPDYLKAMKAAASQLSIEQIDRLFDHGVEPDSYKGFASVDPKLSIEEIDSLRDHGVKPEYYRSMKSVDPNLTIEKMDSLFDHGVAPDSYKGFASVDPRLSIEEIDSLRDHGVKPEYYRSIKSVDPRLPIEEIDSLFDHGVKPDSYKGFASVDSRLTIEEINSLRDHGVEPEFYQGIKAADSAVSIEEIDSLRDHGVEPDYLKEIRALPDGFSISDISELRDHGITAKYIRNLHDMGMKSVTAAQVIHLRDGN
ncbi:M56 family metallopeptidase [Acidobacteria bacterium AB60]|nr:M56 family metallopeptidase [Acidobacteria bacterium AB60]